MNQVDKICYHVLLNSLTYLKQNNVLVISCLFTPGTFPFDSSTFEVYSTNRLFSKMAAENSNRSILKTYTSTRKNPFIIVTLPSFSISGVISAAKM